MIEFLIVAGVSGFVPMVRFTEGHSGQLTLSRDNI